MKQQERYIDFYGNPIHSGMLTKVFVAADAQTAVAVTAGVGVLYNELDPDQVISAISSVVRNNLVFIGAARGICDKLYTNSFSNSERNGKCIDTCPDENTVPTLHKYGLRAEKAARKYLNLTSIWAALDLFMLAKGFLTKGSIGPEDIKHLAGKLPGYARCISGFRRFNNVAKGKWVIVDMPEPEAVQHEIANAVPAPA